MNAPIINVINLDSRKDRLDSIHNQSLGQVFEYTRWSAIENKQIPFMGCSISHKNIVADAKQKGLEYVCIAEDDLVFTDSLAWGYFTKNIPESFDLYLGEVHFGNLMPPDIENNKVKDFCGLTLYIVHSRFYDTFLSLNVMNHLDRELGKIGHLHEYYVCNPMVCKQSGGFSDMKKSVVDYTDLYKGLNFFKSEVSS